MADLKKDLNTRRIALCAQQEIERLTPMADKFKGVIPFLEDIDAQWMDFAQRVTNNGEDEETLAALNQLTAIALTKGGLRNFLRNPAREKYLARMYDICAECTEDSREKKRALSTTFSLEVLHIALTNLKKKEKIKKKRYYSIHHKVKFLQTYRYG